MRRMLSLSDSGRKINMIHKSSIIKFILISLLLLITVIFIKTALFSVHEKEERPISVEETEIQIEQ